MNGRYRWRLTPRNRRVKLRALFPHPKRHKRRRHLGLALLAALFATVAHARPAHGADALDAYRALRSDTRVQLLTYARQEIAAACTPEPPAPIVGAADALAPDWPGAPCGVYLSLTRGRSTRACVGSLTPLGGTLGATLRELARRVVGDDPRHPPLRRDELDSLAVLVSFAGTPQPVADPMAIAPAREGLLVAAPNGSVAFLPGEARTVAWALGEARRIGVLARAADASYERFEVFVLKDTPPIHTR